MATQLTRTMGTPTNNNKYTWSAWIKRGKLGVGETIIYNYYDGNDRGYISFDASDKLFFYDRDTSEQNNCYSTRLLRDNCGWYHLHVLADTTQASAGDRFKVHINGVLETITGTTLDQNDALGFKVATGTNHHAIGTNADSTANPFTGIMSHIHYVDGLAIAHTEFGETDATTGEWKIKTSPTVSEYGANGYFILKDGNSVTDQSGKGNNFTVNSGTLTKTEDCPSNVFCTLNPLQKPFVAQPNDFSNGNTSYQGNHSDWQRLYGTIGAYKGKWFYEWKCTAIASFNNRVGWDSIDNINDGADSYYSGLTVDGDGILRGGIRGHSGYSPDAVQMTAISGGDLSFTTNDILGMALDRDNNTISIYKNGVLEVNAYSFAGASNCSILLSKGYAVAPSVNFHSTSSNTQTGQFNFGNGYFGTTAVSSAGTNASGIGIFEYDVPTGYTALSTKGLNE